MLFTLSSIIIMNTPTPASSPPTESSAAPEAADFALGSIAIAVGIAWLVAIAYAIYPALPYSPARLPLAESAHTALWAPQGWSFFTRDPREEKQTVYVRHGSEWESALLAPHDRPANLAGLRRKSRAQGVEMALLVNGFSNNDWQPCTESLEQCLAQLSSGHEVKNISPAPTMCGTVAVVLQKPVPWAWARSSRPVTMPFRILPLEVSC
jgi:antimicrobial peptide system SdpA family protein